MMKRLITVRTMVSLLLAISSPPILAHDPIFGIGPHTLYKGGIETALETHLEKTDEEKEIEAGLELVYGITGDWAAGIELPYAAKEDESDSSNGLTDIQLFSKYRFWRQDSLGIQKSAAVMIAFNLNNGDETANPKLGNGANDVIGGLTYGHESIKWYHWASVRYRYNGENDAGFHVGNKALIDFAAGWRPTPPEYNMRVDGLACPFCAYGIEKKFTKSEGVKSVDIDLQNGLVIVKTKEGKTFTENELKQLINDTGFTMKSMTEKAL